MINNYQEDENKTSFSWQNMKRILKYVSPYKRRVFIAILLSIISSILVLLIPQIIAYAIDEVFPAKEYNKIIILAGIMLICVLLSAYLSKKKSNQLSILLNKIALDLKVYIFKKLEYLPNTYYDTKSHGKIYTRASTYPDEVAVIFCYILVDVALDFLSLIFVAIFMLNMNIYLSLIAIIPAIILILFFILISPLRRKLKLIANDKAANTNAFLSESVNGIMVTQSFNREEKNTHILTRLENKKIKAEYHTLFVGNLNFSLSGIFNIATTALIYYIGLIYMYPVTSIGSIMAIATYAGRIWNPMQFLSSNIGQIMDASSYLERIFELLDEPLVIEEKKNAKVMDIEGNIEFKHVDFGYNDSLVLNDFNLKIKKGEKVGLVGQTGSGKTTVLSLISRFYDVKEGEITIDGVNIKDLKLNCLRGNISMMLQDNYLFSRSVYDNLVLDKKIELEKVREICKMLEIDEVIMSLEKGYDTILLNNASNLSSGERQLLCIARIMIQNPKVLILDEATSNIDLKTENKLEKALELVTKNRTTLIVAHRISTIKDCDKIVLVKDKKVYEEGTHKELMRKKGEYYHLYTRQSII